MSSVDFEVQGDWRGEPLEGDEYARVSVRVERAHSRLVVNVEATDYGDPAPPRTPGSCDGLWNHEVVELFLLGDGEEYLEIELGPHGHFLVLRLSGRRRVIETEIPIDYRVEREANRWSGEAVVGLGAVPEPIRAGNAFAIHGMGGARRYLAAEPVPGEAPDFHRLEAFRSVRLE